MDFETYPFEKLNILLDGVSPEDNLDMIDLTIGEPQFETPEFIQEELRKSTSLLNKYPKTAGEPYLKDAILEYMSNRFGLKLDSDQVIPTFGTRELLFNFPQFLLARKERSVMAFPNPFYQIYEGAAIASRAEIVHLNLDSENGFKPIIDEKRLRECDLVILNTPNNPTASVMEMNEMREWVKLSMELDFVLLNDECYIDLYLDEALPSMLEASIEVGNFDFKNLFVINSISKRSSAPGLRSGFIAGDSKILKEYMKYRTYIGCASPLPLQRAAAKAWRDHEYPEMFRKKYRKNFQIANDILGVDIPKATFYIWLQTGDELALTKDLYRYCGVKVLPGSFLGRDGAGSGYVRLALVHDEKNTTEALERIKNFLGTRE